MKYIYLLILATFLSTDSIAANYYVSIKTGNDKMDGKSAERAKKTIQAAADKTKPGDTVFVMNGIYTNPCDVCDGLTITRSGKNDRYIVFTNYPGHHPVISFDSWAGISIKNGASYIKINGFEIIGCNAKLTLAKALKQPQSCANRKGIIDARYNGNGILVDGQSKKHSHHIMITGNTVHDCGGAGIAASHADYVYVQGNTVYNTSWYSIFGASAIALYQFWNYDKAPIYHNIISRNKCYNNKSLVPWFKLCKIYDGNGIIIDDFKNLQNGSKLGDYKGRTLIENNICWFNGGTGIHTFQSSHVDILNNTAYCNSRSKGFNPGQILSGLGTDNRIVNNILVADSGSVINSNYRNERLTYQNNLHYNITTGKSGAVNVNSSTCLNGVDPMFEEPDNSLKANFKLKDNSPVLRRGNTGLHSDTDFEGKKRGIGHAPAIGAYED